MRITTILFDMDGTLLPMDQDFFTKSYFKLLAGKMQPYGYKPDELVNSVWKGTASMIKNNGVISNEEAFWKTFGGIFGDRVYEDKKIFDDFYNNEFADLKDVCGFNPEAEKTVRELKDKGYRVVLATNPIFPQRATEHRISWTGLLAEDFELCTSYENMKYSKPNPLYYTEIAEKIGVSPEECLMVGNDVNDDMVASVTGMKVFLLTDCLINKDNQDISHYPQGGFKELRDYISG